MPRIRRRSAPPAVAAALLIAALAAVPARADRIVTWSGPGVSQSRFVDPSAAPLEYYNEPPGVDQRPNALKLNVYLPPGYRTHPDRRYPVLWLLHGHGDAYDSWANPQQGDLLKTAAGFDGIVVMPEGDHGWYTNWWNGGRRGDPAWERYHLDQLIPLVERRLRIRHARRWHAIAGLSMGGEGAMFYATQLPGYFGSVASFSGVLSIERREYQLAFDQANGDPSHEIYGDPQAQEFYWRGHNPRALVDNLRATRVYVSVGDGVPDPTRPDEVTNQFGQVAEAELHQQAGQFVNTARNAGVHVTYHQHQGIHAWRYWREDLRHAIAWDLFAKPPRARDHWIYDTVAQTGRAWSFRYRFSHPPATFETLARSGDTVAGDGSGTVTLRAPRGCEVTVSLPFRIPVPSC